jgi:hypothetical protein
MPLFPSSSSVSSWTPQNSTGPDTISATSSSSSNLRLAFKFPDGRVLQQAFAPQSTVRDLFSFLQSVTGTEAAALKVKQLNPDTVLQESNSLLSETGVQSNTTLFVDRL